MVAVGWRVSVEAGVDVDWATDIPQADKTKLRVNTTDNRALAFLIFITFSF
jgi:hypothetical protein